MSWQTGDAQLGSLIVPSRAFGNTQGEDTAESTPFCKNVVGLAAVLVFGNKGHVVCNVGSSCRAICLCSQGGCMYCYKRNQVLGNSDSNTQHFGGGDNRTNCASLITCSGYLLQLDGVNKGRFNGEGDVDVRHPTPASIGRTKFRRILGRTCSSRTAPAAFP